MESAASVVAFIQARMSSRRYPGKTLAPFRGRPMLDHIVDAILEALPSVQVVVLTSDQPSDDPISAHAASRGLRCFRGSLEDVLGRFQTAASTQSAEWILRVCADSPLINQPMLRVLVGATSKTADLVTTTHRRTLPIGQNAELIRSKTLCALGPELTADDREHVTRFIHRNPTKFEIVSLTAKQDWSSINLAVDTVEALQRLEAMSDAELDRYRHQVLL